MVPTINIEQNALGNPIKKGNVDKFIEIVWDNPRFLISPGDTPVVVHPRTRRNALHLAVQCHQLDICWHIMDISSNRSQHYFIGCYSVL